ncbi:PDZ domain-containing protein [Priestia megaterium]|uniref:SepM family pheromone-processing serine protease n=1 Tax=Priestia megaterium TaxID=1404 RepID=UPI0004706216|nr:SepM family pheromone-processing serine protease [Priestia megaterium]TCN15797.1 PDZ domain-containing protein [Bacillus sp. BK006]
MKSRIRILVYLAVIAVVAMLCFYPLPYYITKPGMAEELAPIIKVEDGYHEKGTFMLTTVRMGRATPLSYGLAKIQDFHEIFPTKQILQQGESDEDYSTRQLHMMDTSKNAAISVAYEAAGKSVSYLNKGVYVTYVVENMPAHGKLHVGDVVTKVDGEKIQTAEDLINYVSTKKAGDPVSIYVKRDGKESKHTLKVKAFPDEPKRVGLGIALETNQELKVKPDIHIDTEKIGGPSAGLMFSLEIYNQLVKEDMTKGHRVAGTGTINDKGEVGPIGGISQKIVAADKEGAEIFFAPNEKGAAGSNYREAVKTAKKIDSDMKIVPVDSFSDAVTYLEKLKP